MELSKQSVAKELKKTKDDIGKSKIIMIQNKINDINMVIEKNKITVSNNFNKIKNATLGYKNKSETQKKKIQNIISPYIELKFVDPNGYLIKLSNGDSQVRIAVDFRNTQKITQKIKLIIQNELYEKTMSNKTCKAYLYKDDKKISEYPIGLLQK